MEIDAGARSDNPGTALSVPGTGPTYAVSAVFRSRTKGKGKMHQEVVPAYPGTDPSVPRTSQPMEIDYVSVKMMEIDQAVFTVREVPSWARPIMDSWWMVKYRQMKMRRAGLQGDPKDIPSSTRKYTREVSPEYGRDVLNLRRAWKCSGRFIRGSVVTTLHPER
jgi:transcription antitermination factor NusG